MRTAYQDWVCRMYHCCVPGCRRTAEPHHVKTKGAHGLIDEGNVAPLCRGHHTGAGAGIHYIGKDTFARRFKVDLTAIAAEIGEAYAGRQVDLLGLDY